MDKELIKNQIIDAIKTVYDVEIPVNVYDLGLIYNINIKDDNTVTILMTLTSPNCPVAESLPVDVRNAAASVKDVKDVIIELTFEPPWDKDMISPAGLLDLDMF